MHQEPKQYNNRYASWNKQNVQVSNQLEEI